MSDIISRGQAVVAVFDDGSTETVRARSIAARDVREYLGALEDVATLVALTVRKPVEWVHKLELSSFLELSRLADEINTGPLADAFHRNIERVELFAPGTKARMLAAISSISAAGAPPSPSSADSVWMQLAGTHSINSTPSGSPSNAAGSKESCG